MPLSELLRSASLPDLLNGARTPAEFDVRRKELLRILARYEYGVTPPAVQARASHGQRETNAYANKAEQWIMTVSFDTPGGEFSFPAKVVLPKSPRPCPVVITVNFRPEVPDQYIPAEEILDHGVGFVSIDYQTVTADNADLTDGLAGKFDLHACGPEGMGKIGCWAYAASRCLDCLLELPEVDPAKIAVAGHSRLGKTALWCAAQDPRFAASFSNNSGAGGDALYRLTRGEHLADLARVFPYWFCPGFGDWAGKEQTLPYDQHFLLAAIAPRIVATSGACEDAWADPRAQLLSAVAASEAFRLYGKQGLDCPETLPEPGERLMGDGVGFIHRKGSHFFSRQDWNFYLDFWQQQK